MRLSRALFALFIAAFSLSGIEPVPTQILPQATEGVRPRNVVFILADDHRYDAMSFMGHQFARTPNMDAMAANGAHTLLVSGGFRHFTVPIAARAGFHAELANSLEIRDGMLTGLLVEPILDREGKLATLRRVAAEHGLTPADALAVGDGANDLAMLGEAGLAVAFHAQPVVRKAVTARIDHANLTALLYLQGYRRENFVLD